LVAGLSVPAAAGMAVLAPEIIRVVYSEKWMPSVDALIILTVFGGVRAVSALNGYLYNGIGKPNIPFYMNSIKLVVIVAVIVPLTAKYGIEGTALAVTVPIALQFIASAFVFSKIIGLPVAHLVRALAPSTVSSAIMLAVVYVLKRQLPEVGIWGLLLLVGTGVLVYGILNLKYIVKTLKTYNAMLDEPTGQA
jgi:O-antigen/teichoic acid export membrane protein